MASDERGSKRRGGGYIKDAVEHDGIFFDTGDELWDALKKSGQDPWTVNEAFLRQRLEEGVDLIEFVGEDVETIIRTWEGVTIEDIPNARYKEVMWLHENASDYGYFLRGNVWRRAGKQP